MPEYIHFITNRGKTLHQTISNLSSSTQNIYILVGFFYFSGFFRLKDELKDKNIRLLIGLDIDRRIGRFIIEYQSLYNENLSILDIRKKFYNSLCNAFSYSDIFDNPEIKESFNIFVDKIKNGTLEIRKTKFPNHAKLYIFENKPEFSQNGDYPGTVITGSSNLSIEGLEKRFEIDVISRDKPHYIEAKKIFDELWNTSVPVVSKESFDEFKNEVLDKIWVTSELPTPYEVYIRVLSEYFAITKTQIRMPKDINSNLMNLAYQNDAISFAVETVKKHNGVIIADVVGLGKSIIASAVAHNLNLDAVIITPPHLEEQWKEYKIKFGLRGEVYTSGKIEKAINDYSRKEGRKLIIVDEAHRYRNTDTLSYNYLWLLCQGNYVLLLTATPFNNTPEDIESLIKLFQSPSKSTLKHIDNLSLEFKKLIKQYSELKKTSKTSKKEEIKRKADEISKRIRYIISPITIRRTRVDLMKIEKYRKDLEKQGIEFPKVNPPDIIPYSFGNLDGLYIDTIEKFIEENNSNYFKAARYKTISYIKDDDYKADIAIKYSGQKTKDEALVFIEQSQKNLSSLIRRIFVKRFESSFGSFSKSIDDYINSHEKIKKYYESGRVPIYKEIQRIPSPDEINKLDDDEREELLKKLDELELNEELIWIDSKKLSDDFLKDLENDIEILKQIKKNWEKYIENPFEYDFKLHKLIEILNEKLANNEKVIIFSEYSDTVDYLADRLKQQNFRVIKYHSSIKNDNLKDEIKNNFDAALPEDKRKNDYDILITTDILSEGINLHRANNIINYDIPYNPTRVIQRIGRVNRVSKLKLKDIYIYNFFPTRIGEKHTNIKNISTLKMYMIHFLLGEDVQYLTTEEDIRSFFYEEYKNSPYFEEESWDVKYRNFLYDIQDNHPQLFEKACQIPYRTKIKRIKSTNKLALTFARKGENFIFKVAVKDKNSYKIETLNDEDAIKLFEATEGEKSFEVSRNFYDIYSKIKNRIFETTSIKPMDRWEREIINKVEKLSEKVKEQYPQYNLYISKLKKLIEFEVLPEYIIKIIRQMSLNSEDDIKELTEKLPEFHIDEVFKRINEYENSQDVIILSEEFSTE